MMNLKPYDGKNIELTDSRGKKWVGIGIYNYPDENEDGLESIAVDDGRDFVYDFEADDIRSIRVLN